MGHRDPRIDAYIARSAPFARPILEHLREIVHATCPEVQETMKWSFPHFDYRGMMCGMSAFKAHCTFGFWKGALVLGDATSSEAMGQFGRITSLKDLPPRRVIAGYVKKAMALNDAGVTVPRAPRAAVARPVVVPPELAAALEAKPKARRAFEAMSSSHRREYCEWIAEAKRPETVSTRVAKTVAQLTEGKSLNAKYESAPAAKVSAPAGKPATGRGKA